MPHGAVRWFDPERGFGFLQPDEEGPDVFVHASEVAEVAGSRLLREGQTVEFEVGDGPRGPQALRVRVTGDQPANTVVGVLGTVSWYEPGKGYGFVAPDGGGPEVFVHSSAIVTGGVVAAGQRAAFLVVPGEKGPQAAHLVPLSADAAGPATDDGADGTVAWFDEGKGFGFLRPDAGGEDVFVHVRALVEGLTWLAEGDRVVFDTVAGDRGPQARDVSLVSSGVPEAPAALGGSKPAAAGPRRADSSATAPGEGVVARFDDERGFGFLTPDAGGPDLFVHVSVLQGATSLAPGDRVRFGIRQSDRGPQADRVELV